jgi:hypothetical protein
MSLFEITGGSEFAHPSFSADAKYLTIWRKTLSEKSEVRIYEMQTRKEVANLFCRDKIDVVSFSSNGRVVNCASERESNKDAVFLTKQWFRSKDLWEETCSRLTRNLTREEWGQFIGDPPYSRTCEQLPDSPAEEPNDSREPEQQPEQQPEQPVALAANLPVPILLSPPDRSAFDIFPRRTTLHWDSVQGASGYNVEIDWCEAADAWIEQGRDWCPESHVMEIVNDLTETTYTFEFVGGNPGRWRVWAIDPNGSEGPKSDYRVFRFMR